MKRRRALLMVGVLLIWGHMTPLWGQTLIHAEKVEIKPPTADRGAESLKVWGGVKFGTAADVGTINSDGKIPEISSTYFASLTGANLTGITFSGWASNSCSTDQIPKWNGSAWACATDQTVSGEGEGSVTSVDLAMPTNEFGISGNPITTSGTITVTWDTQTANYVFAGPASGAAAAPTFRALVAADLAGAGGATLSANNTWTGNNFFTGTWTRVGTTSTTALDAESRFDVVYSGGSAYITVASYGGSGGRSGFQGFAARGTEGSPTASLTGDSLLWLGGRGYHSGSAWASGSRAAISFVAAEDWTSTAQGTYIRVLTTPTGSTTRAERVRISDAGYVGIGTTTPSAALDVIGSAEVSGNLTVSGYMANSLIPVTNDLYSLGDPAKLWKDAWISTIYAVVYAEATAQLFGGYSIIGKTVGSTESDLAADGTQVDLGVAIAPLPQWMVIRAHDSSGAVKAEYMSIDSLSTGTTYNVTRDLADSHATDPEWVSGTPWLLLGVEGDGRLEMFSYSGIPRISLFTQGATYNASNELMRIGGLDGMPGMSGSPGEYGFYVGDNTGTQFLTYYDGNLAIGGAVTAATGYIGGTSGWVIATGKMTSTGIGLATAAGDATYAIWAGDNTPANAEFSVTHAGAVKGTSGSMGGWTLGATSLTDTAGAVGLSSAVTGGDDIRIWAGHATPGSAPFRVTEAGILTATSGALGGWSLGATGMTDTAGVVGLSSAVTGGDDIRFWAGDATPGSAEFRVTESGALTATSATITGAITATSGTFTGTINATAGYLGTDADVVSIAEGGITVGEDGVITNGVFTLSNSSVAIEAGYPTWTFSSHGYLFTNGGGSLTGDWGMAAGQLGVNKRQIDLIVESLNASGDADSYVNIEASGELGATPVTASLILAGEGAARGFSTATLTADYIKLDGLTTLKLAGPNPYYDVTSYSVDNTGTDDCTTSVQSLIDALESNGEGVLFFPPGVYRFDSGVTITGSNISLRGSGRGATILMFYDTSGDFLSIGTSLTRIDIRDMTIYAASEATAAGALIHFDRCSNISLRNLDISAYWGSLRLESVVNGQFSDLVLKSDANFTSGKSGSYLLKIDKNASGSTPSELHFTNVEARGQSGNNHLYYGIWIQSVDGVFFTNLHVGFARYGVFLNPGSDTDQVSGVTMTNFFLDTTYNWGLLASEPSASYTGVFGAHNFSNGHVYNTGDGGMGFNTATTGPTLINNVDFQQIDTHGVQIAQGSYFDLSALTMWDINEDAGTGYGVLIGDNTTYCTVNGLTVRKSVGETPTAAVHIEDTADHYRVTNVTAEGCTYDISDTGTTDDKYIGQLQSATKNLTATANAGGELDLLQGHDLFKLGTTYDVTSISTRSGFKGRVVTLWATGDVTVTDGNNLVLGGTDVALAANEALSLVCDGTNWVPLGAKAR